MLSTLAAPAQNLEWAQPVGASSPGFSTGSGGLAGFADGSTVVTSTMIDTATIGLGAGQLTFGTPGSRAYVARLNAQGTPVWARTILGTLGSAMPTDVAPLPDGSAVVVGFFTGTIVLGPGEAGQTTLTNRYKGIITLQNNFFVARYAANGDLLWAHRIGAITTLALPPFPPQIRVASPRSPNAGGAVVALNAAAAAFFDQPGGLLERNTAGTGDLDGFVAAYLLDGSITWIRQIGGPASFELPVDITIDPIGNSVVLVGASLGNFHTRLAPDGTTLWTVPDNRIGALDRIASFDDGSYAVTRLRTVAIVQGSLERYDASGALTWQRQPTGVATYFSLDTATDGSVFVEGIVAAGATVTMGVNEPNATTLVNVSNFPILLVARFLGDGSVSWARTEQAAVLPIWGTAALPGQRVAVAGLHSGLSTFGAGEPTEVSFASTGFVSSYGDQAIPPPTGEVDVSLPDGVDQSCDPGQEFATVNFLGEISGSPPAGSQLRVRDITGNRILLSQAATTGQFGVGPVTFPIGISQVVAEILDGTSLVDSASMLVTIQDRVPPVLIGCGPKTVECKGTLTVLTRTMLGISATDDCDPFPQVTFSPAAVAMGTNDVIVTARDDSGNTTSCPIQVTVVDTSPPVFTSKPADIERECSGPDGAQVSFDVAAEDACPPVTLVCTDENARVVDPAGTFFADGVHTVTCTATDPGGNRAVHSFKVTIVDNTAPVIICPDDITVGNDPGECFARVVFAVTATDLCDPNVAVVCRVDGQVVKSGDAFPVGTSKIVCTATDKAQNQATCNFQITVEDREAPRLSCPQTVQLVTDCAGSSLAISAAALGASASDNCDASPLIVCSPASLLPGTTTVTLEATDLAGNRSSCLVSVTVLKGPFDCTILRPLDPNVDNRINANRVVPVKVQVACENVFQDDVVATIDQVLELAVGGATPIANEIEDAGRSADEGNVMRLADGHYIYNLSTRSWNLASGVRFKVVLRVQRAGHVDTVCEFFLKNR